MFEDVSGLVLAAGKGTRMKSDLPKVLHEIDGTSMLERVLESIQDAGVSKIITILGQDLKPFETFLNKKQEIGICQQTVQLGTGHAVASAAGMFKGIDPISYAETKNFRGEVLSADYVLITTGDTPALDPAELKNFIEFSKNKHAPLCILGMDVPEPKGYGRLITTGKDKEHLDEIIEEKDTSPDQKLITLCNSGVVFARVDKLFLALSKITNENSQKEYYLTDCVKVLRMLGEEVFVYRTEAWKQFAGVNTPEQLQAVASYIREQQA